MPLRFISTTQGTLIGKEEVESSAARVEGGNALAIHLHDSGNPNRERGSRKLSSSCGRGQCPCDSSPRLRVIGLTSAVLCLPGSRTHFSSTPPPVRFSSLCCAVVPIMDIMQLFFAETLILCKVESTNQLLNVWLQSGARSSITGMEVVIGRGQQASRGRHRRVETSGSSFSGSNAALCSCGLRVQQRTSRTPKNPDTAIVGIPQAEDTDRYGVVEPTVNMKEAINANNSMFSE
ncbi:hypothetical protein CRG98_030891 [Punica granatum]|uniref:Uncharacterized protein n=1 Tax=Punica granatum TaxID=22663 RepID=A0A2I0IXR2_PUNGR|nr:hypothetical protein CRG98_030891 [Punica granatum]